MKQLAPITGTVSVSSNITCDAAGVVEVLNVQGGGGQYTYTLTPVAPTTFVTPIATANNRVQVLRDNVVGAGSLHYPSVPTTISVNVGIIDQYTCSITLGTYTLTIQPKPAIHTVTVTGCSNGNFAFTVVPVAKTIIPQAAAPIGELGDYSFSKMEACLGKVAMYLQVYQQVRM